MKTKLILSLILPLALLVFTSPVSVYAIPTLPHAFYGIVTINTDPAPEGTQISATVDVGDVVPVQNPVSTSGGSFGNPYLLVQGNIQNGAIITFYVNGVKVEGATYTFEVGGGPTEMPLDLASNAIAQKVETVPAGETDYFIDFSTQANTTITVNTIGVVTITVKKYASNPHPEAPLPAEMLPRYIDIEIDNLGAIDWPMYVEQTYTDAEVAGLDESSLGMYYYREADSAWYRCSDTGVNTAANYVWADMWDYELSGSPVAIGGSAAPEPAPEPEPEPEPTPAVGAPALMYIETNLFGITGSFEISDEGEVQETFTATSEDGMLTITIPEGTIALDKDGDPLENLEASIDASPPAPPSHIIGLAFDFGPEGATFDPR